MARIFFETLGCRLNQAESERIAQRFQDAGHELVDDVHSADLRVVNTCTVTAEAGRKSRRAARMRVPGQQVVVTGCHSQVCPEDFTDVDLLVDNRRKTEFVQTVEDRLGMRPASVPGRMDGPLRYPLLLSQTRTFVPIQDGCDNRCSFCMTTVARGPSFSRSVDAILADVRNVCAQGCQEVVLTGVHAGSFQQGQTDLGSLLERILLETEIARVRLSSLEPWNMKLSWIRVWERFPSRMCPHLHMSLQSGCASVLKRMRRHCTPGTFQEKVQLLRERIPNLALTTDLITGFPGETSAEHQEGLRFVEMMKFADAHVFPFSARPGTDAASFPDQVPVHVRRERCRELQALTRESRHRFAADHVGQPVQVLWERSGRSGLTERFLRIESTQPREPNSLEICIPRISEKGVLFA